jgi:ABC-type uncharacterized transport system substrate-binding protein
MDIRASQIASLVLLGFWLPFSVTGHPHNWIDLRIEARFDSDGRVTGLYQQWLFDDYYSVFITEDMDGDGDGKPDRSRLEALRETIFGNLADPNFFTQIEQMSQNVPCSPVTQGAITMRGHRLEISFFLPFESPLDPRLAPLTYRVFDPSYYIEMLHAEAKDAIVLRDAPDGCRHRVERPTPDPEKVAYAASLPAGQNGGNDLGKFFAEKVTIECPARP